jgi:hypothetical protein
MSATHGRLNRLSLLFEGNYTGRKAPMNDLIKLLMNSKGLDHEDHTLQDSREPENISTYVGRAQLLHVSSVSYIESPDLRLDQWRPQPACESIRGILHYVLPLI